MANVLIVDDDELTLLVGRTVLEKAGHRVHFAPNGRDALAMLQAVDVDVVVTDMVMPGIDGLSLIRQIRERHPKIPIIAASGVSEDELVMALTLGATDALSKPVDPRALIEAVEKALESPQVSG